MKPRAVLRGSSTFVYETTIEISGSDIKKCKPFLKYVCVCVHLTCITRCSFEIYYEVVTGSRELSSYLRCRGWAAKSCSPWGSLKMPNCVSFA